MLPCFYIPAGNSSASDNIDDSDDEALFAKPFLTQTEGEHKGIIYKDIFCAYLTILFVIILFLHVVTGILEIGNFDVRCVRHEKQSILSGLQQWHVNHTEKRKTGKPCIRLFAVLIIAFCTLKLSYL